MFIGKVSKHIFALKPRREFYDVEAAQIDPDVLRAIEENMANWEEIQNYLYLVHDKLRQTGAADISTVEVPACLSGAALKRTSTSGSRKRKLSSSTKKKATTSSSPSSEDTSV